MNKRQPEALRLADALDRYNAGVCSQSMSEDYSKAAAELRRLHALKDELLYSIDGMLKLDSLRREEIKKLHEFFLQSIKQGGGK